MVRWRLVKVQHKTDWGPCSTGVSNGMRVCACRRDERGTSGQGCGAIDIAWGSGDAGRYSPTAAGCKNRHGVGGIAGLMAGRSICQVQHRLQVPAEGLEAASRRRACLWV